MLGGLDEALPRVEFTAWPGWPSPGARAGPWASNPALDRVKLFCENVREAGVAGRPHGTALAS